MYKIKLPPISAYDHPIHLPVVYDFSCFRQDIYHPHGHAFDHSSHSHVEISWTKYVIS